MQYKAQYNWALILALCSIFIFSENVKSQSLAEKCQSDGGYAAIESCTNAIKQNPRNEDLYLYRGNAYLKRGENDVAITDYSRAISLNTNYVNAYLNRGIAWSNQGNQDRAIIDFDQVIKLSATNADAYFNRGNAWYKKGDKDRAIIDYNKALLINPNNSTFLYNRGLTLGDKGDLDKAIADYSLAIKIEPNKANAIYNRATHYEKKGQIKDALDDFERYLKLYPKDEAAISAVKRLGEKLTFSEVYITPFIRVVRGYFSSLGEYFFHDIFLGIALLIIFMISYWLFKKPNERKQEFFENVPPKPTTNSAEFLNTPVSDEAGSNNIEIESITNHAFNIKNEIKETDTAQESSKSFEALHGESQGIRASIAGIENQQSEVKKETSHWILWTGGIAAAIGSAIFLIPNSISCDGTQVKEQLMQLITRKDMGYFSHLRPIAILWRYDVISYAEFNAANQGKPLPTNISFNEVRTTYKNDDIKMVQCAAKITVAISRGSAWQDFEYQVQSSSSGIVIHFKVYPENQLPYFIRP